MCAACSDRQEAQDVAIPPVLQEAAHVLTADDVQPEEVQQMIRSATSSSGLSSVGTRSPGWQSPVQPSSSSADMLANASSSPTSAAAAAATTTTSGLPASVSSPLRSSLMAAVGPAQPSTSNAPIPARRAGASPSRMSQHGLSEGVPRASSPMSSTLSTSPPDSALFTPSTSPSPPPMSLPLEAGSSADQSKSHISSNSSKPQTIAARMGVPAASGIHEEDGAVSSAPLHSHPHSHPAAHSPPSATALGFQEPPPVRKPPLRPEFMKGSSQDILQLPGSFPVGSAAPTASAPPSPALDNMEASTLSSGLSDSGLGNSTVPSGSTNRNRRLSFMSYADIISEHSLCLLVCVTITQLTSLPTCVRHRACRSRLDFVC